MNLILTDLKQGSVCKPAKSTHLKQKVFIAFALFLFFSAHLMAQVAPSSFTIVTETPVQSNYSIAGYSNDGNYSTGTTYNLRFGRNSSNGAGANRKVSTFVVSGFTYKPFPRASGLPYSKVVLSRKANPEVTDLNKQSVFFENTGALDGTTLYYVPEYAGTMESLINSFIVNRGTDNVFSNTNGITLNTVERIDMIISEGVAATDISKTGFLIMERGGNDAFRIAAITSLDVNGNAASFGPLVLSNPTVASNWGGTGINITTTVLMKNSTDANLKPDQNINTQQVHGSFISFQAMGISARTTVYGFALFPGDVTASTDLLNLTNTPLNTDAASSSTGGLDFMAGGGFFVEQNTSLAFSLSGNVFHDINAMKDNIVNGTGLNTVSSLQLYAYLINSSNIVVDKVAVNADGSYVFNNTLNQNVNYTVAISTSNVNIGATAPSVANLPSDWVATGENFGSNNLNGSGNTSGIPDLRISVKLQDASISGVNFGIQQLPLPGNQTANRQPNPGGNTTVNVPASLFTPVDFAGGTVDSILITAFPANANTIIINGVPYTSGNFPVGGVKIKANGSGQPNVPITVDPVDGAVTVSIPYKAIDNAGYTSTSIGSANLPFSILSVSKTSDVVGTYVAGDTILYTITVNNNDAVKHAGVTLKDTLPAGLTFVPNSIQANLSPVSPIQNYNFTYSANDSITIPAGVSNITVQAWGGGGRGGSRASGSAGYGGGGGGAFSSSVLTVSPNTKYYITVGAGSSSNAADGGDSWFSTTKLSSGALVLAKGGISVANNGTTGALGGDAASGIGTTKLDGGRGANASGTSYGGGGGSSAGTSLAGNYTSATTSSSGATAPSGGGNGGAGRSGSSGNGTQGTAPGGGGGGALRTSGSATGGNGADGRVTVSYSIATNIGTTGTLPNLLSGWTLDAGAVLTVTYKAVVNTPIAQAITINNVYLTTDSTNAVLKASVTDSAGVKISGNVFNDANALTDNSVNGTGIAQINGQPLFVQLISNNIIVAVAAVQPNGTYSFDEIKQGNYTLLVSTQTGTVGQAPTTSVLSSGWVNTGEFIGTSSGNDGIVNGQLPLTVALQNITNANFGIQKIPVAGSGQNSDVNPGGTVQVNVPANTFSNITPSRDTTPGTLTSIRITTFPTGATTVIINGVQYSSAGGSGINAWPINGVTVPVNAQGQPTVTISADPASDSTTSVIFNFKAIDNGGAESSNTGTATLNLAARTFTAFNMSGICSNNAPYLSYSLTANFNPTGLNANFNWTRSSNTVPGILPGLTPVNQESHVKIITADMVVNNGNGTWTITGTDLWPGAVINAGQGSDWPGWVLENGLWLFKEDGYGQYTNGPSVSISINPTATQNALVYPPSANGCSTIPETATLNGNVYNDANGLNGTPANRVDGTGINAINGTQLYINIINSNNVVTASVPVNANGTYSIAGLAYGNYTLSLSVNQGIAGQTPPAELLNNRWNNTGENLGAGVGSDGSVDGRLSVAVNQPNINNANFGIIEKPVADNKSFTGIDANTLRFNATGNAQYPNKIILNNNGGNANGQAAFNDGRLPGKVSGNDPYSGLISGQNGSEGQLKFVTDGKIYNPVDTSILLNNTVLVYTFEGEDFILKPNPLPSDNAYPFWNAAQQRYIVPNFNANNLSVWFDTEGQSGFFYRYGWMNTGNAVSNTASYLVNATGSLTVLPVELTYFNVSAVECIANLQWQTASEKNNDKFEVFRSTNGVDWVNIGAVDGNGTSAVPQNYSFNDTQVPTSICYYKLKQTDFDGTEEWLPIRMADFSQCGTMAVTVYPNPAKNLLNIQIGGNEVNGVVNFYSLNGALLKSVMVQNTLTQIELNDLPSGTCLVEILQHTSVKTFKIVIAR